MLVEMDKLDMPLGQTPPIHKMHTSRSQRYDSPLIKQELLHMTLAHWMSLQRSVLLQLRGIVRTNTPLQAIVSRIRSCYTSTEE